MQPVHHDANLLHANYAPPTLPTVPLPPGYVDFNNVMREQQHGQMQQMELRRSEAGIDREAEMQMYGNSEHDKERSRDEEKDTTLHVKKRVITAEERWENWF